jgi:hypothetical protein
MADCEASEAYEGVGGWALPPGNPSVETFPRFPAELQVGARVGGPQV